MKKVAKKEEKKPQMEDKNNGAIVLTNAHMDKKNKAGKKNQGGCC